MNDEKSTINLLKNILNKIVISKNKNLYKNINYNNKYFHVNFVFKLKFYLFSTYFL